MEVRLKAKVTITSTAGVMASNNTTAAPNLSSKAVTHTHYHTHIETVTITDWRLTLTGFRQKRSDIWIGSV